MILKRVFKYRTENCGLNSSASRYKQDSAILRICYIKCENCLGLLKIIEFRNNVKVVNLIKISSNWSWCIFRIRKYLSATFAIISVWNKKMSYLHCWVKFLARYSTANTKETKKKIHNKWFWSNLMMSVFWTKRSVL